MDISDGDLTRWASPPGTQKAENTYSAIKTALSSLSIPSSEYEIYLQGSYSNSTNITGESDVDVVAQLKERWQRDISRLPLDQQRAYLDSVTIAPYGLSDFERDVISCLKSYFGAANVTIGGKSIKIKGNETRLNADVLVCIDFRIYTEYHDAIKHRFIEGLKFFDRKTDKGITNFPKHHKANGEDKNHSIRTNLKFKQNVRIVKNIKGAIADHFPKVDLSFAPSYFIECSIYNVPDAYFVGDFRETIKNITRFMRYECNPDDMWAANHVHKLFGTEPWEWNLTSANSFYEILESVVK